MHLLKPKEQEIAASGIKPKPQHDPLPRLNFFKTACSTEDDTYAQELFGVDASQAVAIGALYIALLERNESEMLVNSFGDQSGGKELVNGPKRADFNGKNLDQVLGPSWIKSVINSKIDCRPVGYRGWRLANGLLWYTRTDSTFIIFAMNNWEK